MFRDIGRFKQDNSEIKLNPTMSRGTRYPGNANGYSCVKHFDPQMGRGF